MGPEVPEAVTTPERLNNMRTLWNNLYDIWEIFIEDPQDPALLEFGFPDAVHGWLRSPESYVGRFSAVEQISPHVAGGVARRGARRWDETAAGHGGMSVTRALHRASQDINPLHDSTHQLPVPGCTSAGLLEYLSGVCE